MKMKAENKF